MMTELERTCLGCDAVTRSVERLCRNCEYTYATAKRRSPEAHGLRGGDWVKRGGVFVFVAAERVEEELPVIDCGTDQGYYMHRKCREETCKDCRSAHAVVERLRKADKRIAEARMRAEEEARGVAA